MKFNIKNLLILIIIFGAAGFFGQSFVASVVSAVGLAGQVASFLVSGLVGVVGVVAARWLHVLK